MIYPKETITNDFTDLQFWNDLIAENKKNYGQGEPFPHIVLDNFLLDSCAKKLLEDFPSIGNADWIHYLHFNEKKHGLNKISALPYSIKEALIFFNSPPFVKFIEQITGINNLLPDDSYEGGGLHQSKREGFLNVHADFTVHPHNSKWKRRVNVLIYLNKDWKEDYNGHLELWSRDMKECKSKIAPLYNRCVIFNTDETSYHGVPETILCPEDMTRKSIALYYYTEEAIAPKKIATNYKARPTDGMKSILIYLDKKGLSIYNSIKGILGINDKVISNLLRFLSKFNRKK